MSMVEASLVLLEEGVCYDQNVLLASSLPVMKSPSCFDQSIVSGSLSASPGTEDVWHKKLKLSSWHLTMTALVPSPSNSVFRLFLRSE